ncbi:MAG: hypothetical protein WAX80_02650 [Minisyncoccia bacterium]
MKPYLTPNPTLAFVIEWGVLIISILLVFSPFIYLGIRKWKRHLLINWKQVIGAYLSSFAIYFVWEWVILDKLDQFISNNYINAGWLQNAFFDPGFRMIFVVVITWPLLVFYCSKLVTRERFTLLNFITSFIISILLFCGLVVLLFYAMAAALGYAGSHYF